MQSRDGGPGLLRENDFVCLCAVTPWRREVRHDTTAAVLGSFPTLPVNTCALAIPDSARFCQGKVSCSSRVGFIKTHPRFCGDYDGLDTPPGNTGLMGRRARCGRAETEAIPGNRMAPRLRASLGVKQCLCARTLGAKPHRSPHFSSALIHGSVDFASFVLRGLWIKDNTLWRIVWK